jgi:hypothetical protein
MCSACAGDYENPEMTAPDLNSDVGAPQRPDDPRAGEGIVAASVRLREAIEQLARVEHLELELLREAMRVTQQASEALDAFGPSDAPSLAARETNG